MPVIRDVPLSLKMGDVLRREGFGGQPEVRPEIKSLIEELLTSVESNRLLEPVVAYEIYTVTEMSQDRISLNGSKAVHGPALPAIFPEAKEIAVLIGTIGPRLAKQASDYTQNGEALRGMMLDGIGSAAVDALVPKILKAIAAGVSSRGYEISSPVNPGMPGFPMTEQWNLLKLVRASEIGVSLTHSGILVPRKSVSMVIGIGTRMTRWTQAEVCARCSLRQTCPYKVTE